VAKTIADGLKYRKKLGGNLAGKVLARKYRPKERHRVTGAQHLIRKHVQQSRNHKNRGDSYCYSRAPNVFMFGCHNRHNRTLRKTVWPVITNEQLHLQRKTLV
jgi:hypothetical protein